MRRVSIVRFQQLCVLNAFLFLVVSTSSSTETRSASVASGGNPQDDVIESNAETRTVDSKDTVKRDDLENPYKTEHPNIAVDRSIPMDALRTEDDEIKLCGDAKYECCPTDVTACAAHHQNVPLDISLACTTACCPIGECLPREYFSDLQRDMEHSLPSRCRDNFQCCDSAHDICADGSEPIFDEGSCLTHCCQSCQTDPSQPGRFLRFVAKRPKEDK